VLPFSEPLTSQSYLRTEMSTKLTEEQLGECKDAFSLFDRKSTGLVPTSVLGDLLRAVGQNPTQAEVQEIVDGLGQDVSYDAFLKVVSRPSGFNTAGSAQEFIQGFQVFDKEGDGYISTGELRYVLTSLGEKLTNEEVDELLKGLEVDKDGRINYVDFVHTVLSN